MKYCSLQHRDLLLSPVHPQVGIAFALPQSLHSFWSYVSTDLQQHIGHLPTWGVHLSVSFLPFLTIHEVLKARILTWFAIPFSSGLHSVRPLHHDPSVLGGPIWHGLVLLSQTRLWSCDQIGQLSVIVVSVCLPSEPLSQCLPSYLGFTYLGHGVSLHRCSSKAQLLLVTSEVEGSSPPLPPLTSGLGQLLLAKYGILIHIYIQNLEK